MNRRAVIDLGTNTFHLLIGGIENGSRVILTRKRVAAKVGQGGINSGLITDDGLRRAIGAMETFRNIIGAAEPVQTEAFATSAFRTARNGVDAARQIEAVTGIAVRIISGDEEASFIYRGVRAALPLGDQPALIIDIGAGSVEFIIANDREIFWKQSVEVGAQRLLEMFQQHDPPLPSELAAVKNHLHQNLGGLRAALLKYQPALLAGSSGTFDTLSEMYCIRERIPYDSDSPETPLTIESFRSSYETLKRLDRAGRLALPGMIELRADMIVVACCLIEYVLEYSSFSAVRVSTWSLKEGVLWG